MYTNEHNSNLIFYFPSLFIILKTLVENQNNNKNLFAGIIDQIIFFFLISVKGVKGVKSAYLNIQM